MRAIVRDEYGPADLLRLEEVPRPIPKDDEVLVRVRAAAVNKGDTEILQGKPLWVRLVGFGFFKPKIRILGTNLAGVVEAVGQSVTEFQVGDEVFGDILQQGLGAFADYVCIPESAAIVCKPSSLGFEQAASLPEAGFIALQGLRDKGQLEPGHEVLINGAGGGAGSFAIQLAKSHGAEVTAVDSAAKQDWMRSLGADHCMDYAHEGFALGENRYDIILDVVGAQSLSTWRRSLAPEGIYLAVGGSVPYIAKTLFFGAGLSLASNKRIGMLGVRTNKQDLHEMIELVETDTVAPTIDQRYDLSQTAEAMSCVAGGHAKGRVVITF